MPNDRNLPLPPEFPASNASYNKIVDKMHKAALNASTCAAAITAVTAITAHVTGVNTYSKKCRRYGDDLIAALKGEAPADPVKAKTEKAAAKMKVNLADKGVVQKAAAEGDPVAGFMIKGANAQKAVDALTALPNGRKFSNKSNAKRALKSAALDHLPVQWVPGPNDDVMPVLTVSDDKGLAYASERGFAAKVAA